MSIVNDIITVRVTETATYGISPDDLRRAFRSSRKDLLLLICEDKPSDAASDADPADTLTDGSQVISSAFALSTTDYDSGTSTWTRTDRVPLPSGWSLPAYTAPATSRSYEKGDLIKGRRPRWDIWADGINVGKVVEYDGYQFRLRYNIFKNPWTRGLPLPSRTACPGLWPEGYTIPSKLRPSGGLPDLFSFQGYDTKHSHKPFFRFTMELSLEWHNGVPTVCRNSNTMNCKYGFTDWTPYPDSLRIFLESENETPGIASMALGNIVDWWMTAPYYSIYGLEASISYLPSGSVHDSVIAHVISAEESPLGYNTPEAAKSFYREGRANGDYAGMAVRLTADFLSRILWNDLIGSSLPAAGDTRSLPVTLQLCAIRTQKSALPAVLTDNNRIYLDDVLEPEQGNIHGLVDRAFYTVVSGHFSSGSERYRFILRHAATKQAVSSTSGQSITYDFVMIGEKYLWPLHGSSGLDGIMTLWDSARKPYTKIWFQFALLSTPGTEAQGLTEVSTLPVMAFWDIVCCSETTGKVVARYKCVKQVSSLAAESSFGDRIFAKDTSLPRGSKGFSTDAMYDYTYVTGVSYSEIGCGLTSMPASTTARLKLEAVSAKTVCLMLRGATYTPVCDSFRLTSHIGSTSYGWFFQDYDMIMEKDNSRYRISLYAQLFALDSSSNATTSYNATWPSGKTFTLNVWKNGNSSTPEAEIDFSGPGLYQDANGDGHQLIISRIKRGTILPGPSSSAGACLPSGDIYRFDLTLDVLPGNDRYELTIS